MKHHFTYRLTAFFAVLTVAFVFAACGADTEKTAEETTSAPMADNAEATHAAGGTVVMDSQNGMGTEETTTAVENTGERVFTLEELGQYDGKDGRPAYVAVDGVVYDVSDKPLWAGGEHQNRVSAGQDLSEAILSSPHGKAKLKELPVVGTLAEE